MDAIDLVQSLMAEGVEFAADGECIRRSNSGGCMTPARVAEQPAAKPALIDFQTRIKRSVAPSRSEGLHTVDGARLDFLHLSGPSTYGAAAIALGWSAKRARQADARLRAARLVQLEELGRAVHLKHMRSGAT